MEARSDRPPGRKRAARSLSVRGAAGLLDLPAPCPPRERGARVVVSGRPTLRTLDGERELSPGEVVAFPVGRRGGHRLDNRSDAAVQVLIVSTMLAPEVSEYPDSGKVWARTYAPGAEPGPEEAFIIARPEDNLDYMDGER